jgi:hypothetical protein
MPEKPRSSLLDQLRERSAAIQEERAASRLPEAKALQAIEAALWRAFRWLEEAMGHLEVIQPDVRHRFRLGDYLTFDRLQVESGFAVFRRRGLGASDRLEHVEMFYELATREPAVFRVKPLNARSAEDGCGRRRSSSTATTKSTRTRSFSARYSTSSRRSGRRCNSSRNTPGVAIEVSLRNVDRFESVQLEFEPLRIDEPALEDSSGSCLANRTPSCTARPLAHVNAKQ